MKPYEPLYNKKEEIVNVITHALGIILSCIGIFLLYEKTKVYTEPRYIVGALIFGFSLLLLYIASTSYHAVEDRKLKSKLNTFDRSVIYIAIAGTYTPYCLVSLAQSGGKWLLIFIWSISIIGIFLRVFEKMKFEKIATLSYVLAGWLFVIKFRALDNLIPEMGFFLLILGGVFYSIGVFFYAYQKIPYNHGFFHVFVLLGSISHFISIYEYVL